MQILGKRSKILLIAIAIAMLVAIGVSFAAWDSMSTVKAASDNLSTYANAKVGDIVEFGRYYQTGKRVNNDEKAEYEKTPIRWIVVDKDERTGQLTLMSMYILAAGSYFGNMYYNDANSPGYYYTGKVDELSGNPFNQAYVDSTARAYLNNLERLDLGGDGFLADVGYVPSKFSSTNDSGLYKSIGFSNQKYWTGLNVLTGSDLVDAGNKGFSLNDDVIYFKRPISNSEYRNRPATRGFFDEAFSNKEKSMIVPKSIAGNIGHRWPDTTHDIATTKSIEGMIDKVWLPSATELNIDNGQDWSGNLNDAWSNSTDKQSSSVFEYVQNYQEYKNPTQSTQMENNKSVAEAIKTIRTPFAMKAFAANYSIPVYDYQSTVVNTKISTTMNSGDTYWIRSISSFWFASARLINDKGRFAYTNTCNSDIGIRPCVIIKY